MSAVALWLLSLIFSGVYISGVGGAIVGAAVIAVLDATIKPILQFLSIPITVLTLGIFYLVVNAGVLLLAARFAPGFDITGFWTAFWASIVLSILHSLLLPEKKKN